MTSRGHASPPGQASPPGRGGVDRAPWPLARVCAGEPDAWVVPAEGLEREGDGRRVRADVREVLRGAGLAEERLARLEEALSLRERRLSALAARAPRGWYPPRAANLIVIRAGRSVRPYDQPLRRSSWVLCEEDLGEDQPPEVGAYLLCHAERLGFVGDPVRAFLSDLGWWGELDDAAVSSFTQGAGRSRRSDAGALRALASSLPWIRGVFDAELRPPPEGLPTTRIPGTELLIPTSSTPLLARLVAELEEAVRAAAAPFSPRPPRRPSAKPTRAGQDLAGWLKRAQPRVLVTSARGEPLWTPASPNHVAKIQPALAAVEARVAASLQRDWEVVDERTRRFLDRVVSPEELPRASGAIDVGDGVWIDAERRLIAYALVQPGLRATEEPAPPLHRWLLAARTAHEWAHLAEDVGWVRVPDARAAEHAAAIAELGERFEGLVRDAPAVLAEVARKEAVLSGGAEGAAPGPVFADVVFRRVGDWRANLLAREILEPEELWAYARGNARTHAMEGLGPFAQLCRHAIEVHYLGLAGADDPAGVLFASTFFEDHFARTGLCDEARARRLFEASGRALACWEIDRARFRAPET